MFQNSPEYLVRVYTAYRKLALPKKEYHQEHLSLCSLFKDRPDYLTLQSVYSVSEELSGSHSTHTKHEEGKKGPPG